MRNSKQGFTSNKNKLGDFTELDNMRQGEFGGMGFSTGISFIDNPISAISSTAASITAPIIGQTQADKLASSIDTSLTKVVAKQQESLTNLAVNTLNTPANQDSAIKASVTAMAEKVGVAVTQIQRDIRDNGFFSPSFRATHPAFFWSVAGVGSLVSVGLVYAIAKKLIPKKKSGSVAVTANPCHGKKKNRKHRK